MKTCRHLQRLDIKTPRSTPPACVLCEECLQVASKAIRIQVLLMHDAEDDTDLVTEKGLQKLLYDLTGETSYQRRKGRKHTKELV